MQKARLFVLLAFAFAAGAFASRVAQPATATADVPTPVATSIDLLTLDPTTFPAPNAALPDLRTKGLAVVDSTSFYYQVGVAPKHTHAATTEVQLFLDGTGTEWLGDKQIAIAPGTFVLIPPGTAHGGFTGGPFKFYTVKTPPQQPADFHAVP
jgi:mannose-6-phosphate isomerase-like protein (cupin superfamily)